VNDRSLLQPNVFLPFALVVLIWGSTWLVITGQLGTVPPAWSVSYRFAIAAALMFGFAATRGVSLRIGRDGHAFAAAFGILQFGLNFNFVYLAEQHVTSGVVAMVYAILFVPNSLLALYFLKHRISSRFLAGSLLAIIGVTLLFLHELRSSVGGSGAVAQGIALSLLGVVTASIANVIQAAERLRDRAASSMVAWAMTYGVLFNAVLALILYGPPTFEASLVYVGGLLYLALFGSAVAFTLYMNLLRAIGPGRAAYTGLLIPVIGMALSTLFENYRWSILAVTGSLLAMAGLFIALRARRSDRAPA
jgi:drug/metabolite transporter (DMT)-like permease